MTPATAAPQDHAIRDTLAHRGVTLVPTTPDERAEMLENTGYSRRLAWKQIVALAASFRCYELAAGTVLFREGDRETFCSIVIEGALEVRKLDDDGTPRAVGTRGRGKMIGEMSLLDGTLRSASAVATAPTRILVLTDEDYAKMKLELPALCLEFTILVAMSIAEIARFSTGSLVAHLHDAPG